MKIESHNPFFLRKHRYVLLKFALFLLFASLSFHIFFSVSLKLISSSHQKNTVAESPLDSTPILQDLAQIQPQNGEKIFSTSFLESGKTIPHEKRI